MVADSCRAQALLVATIPQEGRLYYEVTVTPVLGPESRLSLLIMQVQDVIEFKRMEQTVREYNQSLEEKVAGAHPRPPGRPAAAARG